MKRLRTRSCAAVGGPSNFAGLPIEMVPSSNRLYTTSSSTPCMPLRKRLSSSFMIYLLSGLRWRRETRCHRGFISAHGRGGIAPSTGDTQIISRRRKPRIHYDPELTYGFSGAHRGRARAAFVVLFQLQPFETRSDFDRGFSGAAESQPTQGCLKPPH